MNQSFFLRICIYIATIFCIINGWWFIALPLLLLGAWKFSFKIEIVLAGVVYDALFGMVKGTGLWGYVGTLTAIVVVLLFMIFRKMIR
jgi:hypothetical protein